MKYNREQKTIIFVAITTAFVTTFTGSALNLSIPAMGKYFAVSASAIGWLVTAYMLTVAALSVPFGRIADLTGRKRILIMGIFLFAFSALLASFGVTMWMMILLRITQGTGAAMIFSTNTAVLISAFPGEKRGRVLGYSIAATYIGLSVGPVAGGILNHYLGWRSIFALTALIGSVALMIAWKKLPKDCNQGERTQYDILGSLLYIAAIFSVMFGLSEFSKGWVPVCLIVFGMALGVIFVLHERRIDQPVVQIGVFRKNPAYTFSNLAALMNYGATFAIGYLLSIYLQVVMGYNSQTAGMILMFQPLLMAIISPYAGRLSDRISSFKLASFGMGLCAVSVFICSFLSASTPLWVVFAALAATGVGFGLFSSPNTNAIMACVERQNYGVASSILATMRSIGHTLSMAIVTLIVSHNMGSKALADAGPELLVQTMHMAFLIFTGICLIGVFFSLKRKKNADE